MLLLLALACGDASKDVEPQPLTGTFPQFKGDIPKNLLFVSIDTFRKDNLSRYGDDPTLTPFLDGLFEQGVALDRHRSCSNWTMPSILCVITGESNVDAGYVPDLHGGDDVIMPERSTLATWLADAGYETILVTSNSWYSADHNSDQGFTSSQRASNTYTSGVFEEGMELAQGSEASGRPWFLHLHVKEPHSAYNPPEEYLEDLEGLPAVDYDLTDQDEHYNATSDYLSGGMSEEDKANLLEQLQIRYHGELRYLDRQLQDGFTSYSRAGLLDNTLVVIWNDHGEQFWEHGLQSHAHGLNREENDGIGLFWARNIVPATWDESTWHPDITATVLDLLAVEPEEPITGVAVGQADPERIFFTSSMAREGPMQAVNQGNYKLIYRWETGERWLYDTVADPEELYDLYAEDNTVGQAMDAELGPEVTRLIPLVPDYYTPFGRDDL